MKRVELVQNIETTDAWDVIVIGGGATGLGVALDAVTRGYSTLLLEANDFAKGTSSRSTKLVHGGVRYLAQGNVALVREALRERGRLAKNAPHLFKTQSFIIPGEKWWTAPYYTFGLMIYDLLAGKLSIGHTSYVSKDESRQRLKGVKASKLNAGVCYYDGQFDDARLATTLAQSIVDNGGTVLNYCRVTDLQKDAAGKVSGVCCKDTISGKEYTLKAKAVVNATGVFANDIMAMDEPGSKARIVPSQGIHLVLDREFLPNDDALMVPKTSDGRVLFAVPWHNKIVVGTTDTLVKDADYEPKPIDQEVQFILDTAKDYLTKAPTRADVRSVFAGLRPLAAPKEEGKSTKEVSRSHKVEVSDSGLVHILGGKWTTYRQMAEDTVDAAIESGLIFAKSCKTVDLPLHGYDPNIHLDDSHLSPYGTDAKEIEALAQSDEKLAELIHKDHPYIYAQVKWAMDNELASTLEDVLARRIRLLFLDARAAEEAAQSVAEFMALHLGWNEERVNQEVSTFTQLVKQYLL
ncbi:glycerol-3-phosphate dehydrogenase/oxidase [Pasteurella atlantica]|uniref:Glycerol-3-phosphate dehydrogenase/oxidase n=2 Tax=Pasteurellaceae TaxID=712 RepID=A0ACC6HJQ0_9PAST|nr:glycerol-3-phosphate dehydrogenase/oxidase [Pasteurella atlantica]MDP8051100.1 glycerol-3-phosphate dehydrogenase/oxidase [Pasteurella atlantica]MDP8104396.1 glycerol-3-phosphate dehydrogenase/oxidase [Pasteurella atlantica]MDP8147756.1 glycerol-3-phosphate dehydrogenase/oxidase [Pasteurella atlantica]